MLAWPHWLPLSVLVPLAGAVLTMALASERTSRAWALATATAALTAGIALVLAVRVALHGPFSYSFGGWQPPYGIEFRFDELSALSFVVAAIALLAIVFARRYAERAIPYERTAPFYALMLLVTAGMIGFSVTGDLFNLYVFMEVLSLSSYALAAASGERISEMAAFKYLVLGAVSSLTVLFSIGFMYALTGSLNMLDIAHRLSGVETLPLVVAVAGATLGFMVKAAIFPLHIWLPDAHASAPSPVSAILSGLVVKMGIVGVLRIWQMVLTSGVLDLATLDRMLVWLGAISIVMGAFFAIFQDDIKMMLAYSTISNIGYIVMGIGLMSRYSLTGACVHVFNHAIIKATLFLAAGAIIHQTGYRTLSDLRGVGRGMPITTGALSIGAISIVGIPPTAGFLCKWYIALGAFEAKQPLFGVALVFGALFIFVYYIRMVNAFYFETPRHAEVASVGEAPLTMIIPVVVLATLCLVMGLLGRVPLSFIEPAVVRMLTGAGG